MLVGVDASRAIADHPTGTETYSRRLIQALLRLDTPHSLRLYFRSVPPADLFPGAELRAIPFPRLWTHVRLAWEMARHPPDLLFVPAHVLPPIQPRRSLVTIHDLGYLAYPEAHPFQQRLYLDLSTRWNARRATHILADSEATEEDLVRHYGIEPTKLTVAYPGRDEKLQPVEDSTTVTAAKERYGIRGDYFLYLGTIQPRKNLHRLIEAFDRFTSRHPSTQIELVLAGKRGWLCDQLLQDLQGRDLGQRVHLPGYVAEDDKAPLLSGAIAFVFPSLHEGFGLPVVEAQACGCPVITSTTSSLPEAAGDGALLVDPRDTEAIADAMARLSGSGDLRAKLIERGFSNSKRFSWDACAKTVLSVIDTHLC